MDTEQGRSWALLRGGLHRPSGSSSRLSPEMPAPPLPSWAPDLPVSLELGAHVRWSPGTLLPPAAPPGAWGVKRWPTAG